MSELNLQLNLIINTCINCCLVFSSIITIKLIFYNKKWPYLPNFYEYASWDKKIVYISFGTVIILTAYRELLLYVRSSSCTNNLCWYDDLPWYEKKAQKNNAIY